MARSIYRIGSGTVERTAQCGTRSTVLRGIGSPASIAIDVTGAVFVSSCSGDYIVAAQELGYSFTRPASALCPMVPMLSLVSTTATRSPSEPLAPFVIGDLRLNAKARPEVLSIEAGLLMPILHECPGPLER